MLDAAAGLTDVPTADLKKLLGLVHRGDLQLPLTVPELTRVGLQHAAGRLLSPLRGLDAPALRTILVCVIAERRPANRQRRMKAEAGVAD